jgi:hypothetical protein
LDRRERRRVLAGVTGVALPCAVLAMVLAAGCSSAQPPAAVAQAGPLQAVSPAGLTAWPFEFAWRGGTPDAVVRVRIFDEAERVVYGIDVRGTRAQAPDDLRRLLKSGSPYLWRVARLDENGQEVDQSDLTAFSVR